MTPLRAATFRIDDELLDAMELLKERDGIPYSEQIRRGLKLWFDSKGVQVKARPVPKRGRPRKK